MKVTVYNSTLSGKVKVPSSKSYSHRLLISSALYYYIHKKSITITNLLICDDTIATINVLNSIGFRCELNGNTAIISGFDNTSVIDFDCCASGSTARFFIPIISYFKPLFNIRGCKKLISRLNTNDLKSLKGLEFKIDTNILVSGRLEESEYELYQDNTTQFISGMIFIMPLYKYHLVIYGELSPYVQMTLDSMKSLGFKFNVDLHQNKTIITFIGYNDININILEVEGDYSNASYYFNMLSLGNDVYLENLNKDSLQGDKVYSDILEMFSLQDEITVDISLCPDLGPSLFAYASVSNKDVIITGIEKLYLKESNRVDNMIDNLVKLGGEIYVCDNAVKVVGKKNLNGGCTISSYDDHRIVMAITSIATRFINPVTILNSEAVCKSYPDFFKDYQRISGKIEIGE